MFLSDLFRVTKYDIAISVAKEDIEVAEEIAAELLTRKITYYLFSESDEWGENIFPIVSDAFGRNSKYVLLITSEIYKERYWAGIERLIATQYSKRKRGCVLELKLDNSEIDGIGKHVIFKNWNNNASQIANSLQSKLAKYRKHLLQHRLMASLLFLLIIGSTGFVFYKIGNGLSETHDVTHNDNKKSQTVYPTPEQLTKPVTIPESRFLMGYRDNSNKFALPHMVTIHSFKISPTEVTIDQYLQYCKNNKVSMPPQPYGRTQGSYPVVNVSWYNARDYCAWNNGRLPTEAEWEYAAGAGLEEKYSGGDGAKERAVYGTVKPCIVGTKLPNRFGLYDMTGNVAEWCNDWYDSLYYMAGDSVNPHGPMIGIERIVRGGAYMNKINPVNELHISFRNKELPGSRRLYIGFRVVWDK